MRLKDSTTVYPGIPGAGKTVMAAFVVDHPLRTQHTADRPAVFVYCLYAEQTVHSFGSHAIQYTSPNHQHPT